MGDNATTVDDLNVRLSADATGATEAIDKLISVIDKFVGQLKPAISMGTEYAKSLDAIAASGKRAKAGLSGIKIPKIPTAKTGIETQTQLFNPNKIKGGIKQTSFISPDVSANLDKTKTAVEGVNTALDKTTSKSKRAAPALSTLQQRFDRVEKSNRSLTKTLLAGSSVLAGYYALKQIGRFLKNTFQSVMGGALHYAEAMNLVAVAAGDAAPELERWATLAQNKLGLDKVPLMEAAAGFQQIGTSAGITSDKAFQMSKGLSQLAYDFASLRDVDIEESLVKFQGAFVGETKAIRRWGIDTSVAAQQEWLAKNGIDARVQSLSQATKMQIRYNIMMEHGAMAQVDFSKTLDQPANMLRVLQDRLGVVSREIGSLFIPMLKAVLPYLLWFSSALMGMVEAIRKFFNLPALPSVTDFKPSIGGGLSDELDDATDAAGGTAAALKKIKDYTTGLDELNILKPDEPSAGGGGGVSGGGATLDIPISEPYDWLKGLSFDDLIAGVQDKVDKFKLRFKPFTDALAELWAALKPFARRVGYGLQEFYEQVLVPIGGWVVNVALVWFIEKLIEGLDWFNDKPNLVENITKITAALVLLTGIKVAGGGLLGLLGGIGKFFGGAIFGGIGSFIGFIGRAISMVWGLVGVFMNNGGLLAVIGQVSPTLASAFSGIGAFIAGISAPVWAVIAAIAAILVIAWNKSEQFRNMVSFMWESIKTAGVNAWERLSEALAPLWDALKGLWQSLKDLWGMLEPVLMPVIITLASIVAGVLYSAFLTIMFVINQVINVIKAIAQSITGVVNVFSGFIDVIVGFFTGDGTKIESGWNKIKDGIGSIFEAIWTLITSPFTAFWETIKAPLETAWTTLTGWFSGRKGEVSKELGGTGKTELRGYGMDLAGGVESGASSKWTGVSTWFKSRGTAVSNAVGTGTSTLKSFGTNVIGGIDTGVRGAWTTTGNWFRNVSGTVSSSVGSGINTLRGFGGNLMSGMSNGINSAWYSVSSWFWNLGSTIVRAVGSGFDLLNHVGKNIIYGLYNGIISMASWLVTKLASFVTRFIPEPIARALRMRSPSRLMADMGVNIPLGLVMGIERGGGSLLSASLGMVDTVVDSMSGVADGAYDSITNLGRVLGDAFGDGIKSGVESASLDGLVTDKLSASNITPITTGDITGVMTTNLATAGVSLTSAPQGFIEPMGADSEFVQAVRTAVEQGATLGTERGIANAPEQVVTMDGAKVGTIIKDADRRAGQSVIGLVTN